MKRLLALSVAGLLPIQAIPAVAQADELRTKAARFVTDWQREGGLPDINPDAELRLVELNGADPPEALVILRGVETCGSRGCTAFVLDLRGQQARSIGDFIAHSLEPLPTSSNGWRDLSLNGQRITFEAGKYR